MHTVREGLRVETTAEVSWCAGKVGPGARGRIGSYVWNETMGYTMPCVEFDGITPKEGYCFGLGSFGAALPSYLKVIPEEGANA